MNDGQEINENKPTKRAVFAAKVIRWNSQPHPPDETEWTQPNLLT
jgi:hypothetical protein